MPSGPSNVFGNLLKPCCRGPITGFYRDGYCRTGPGDVGLHTVCVEVTAEFLAYLSPETEIHPAHWIF